MALCLQSVSPSPLTPPPHHPAPRSPRLCLAAGALAATATALVTPLWAFNVSDAVYTSAAVSLHRVLGPTFSAGTWLNTPVEVAVFDAKGPTWAYQADDEDDMFQVDMARHTESFGSGALDTFAAQASIDGPDGGCVLRGWSSLSSSSTPGWEVSWPSFTSALLMDSDRYVDVSDDGSTLAFSATITLPDGSLQGMLSLFDAQSGGLLWRRNSTVAGPVQVSAQGSWVAWTQNTHVTVLSGVDGTPRCPPINMGWDTMAVLSDAGDVLAWPSKALGQVARWNATAGAYALSSTVVPSGGVAWEGQSAAISGDADGLVAFAYTDAPALTARVLLVTFDGKVVADYVSATNAVLQTVPVVRCDGQYAAAVLWGDSGEVPTVVLLRAGSVDPGFTAITPGSMFGVDVAVTKDVFGAETVYLVVAGKDVPANSEGDGGQAIAWVIQPK